MNTDKGYITTSRDRKKNFLEHEGKYYEVKSLYKNPNWRAKGGNSAVFNLVDPDDPENEMIIKFSKYNIKSPPNSADIEKRITRFEREIEALEVAKEDSAGNVILILFHSARNIKDGKYRYYVMEKADSDLTEFLKYNSLSLPQRLLLCTDILSGVKQLHNLGIYHRDIKPDNILMIDSTWKIGDLGLSDYRDSDFLIDEIGEKIGPIGWLSPEAMNKYFNEGNNRDNPYGFDCILDEHSDVFQLGKLFWFIFQGNIPIGQIQRADFKIEDNEIFEVIKAMLAHSKNRPSIDEIASEFEKRQSHYGI